jgi:ABC-type nitrate/sulfonate/bicarbonate transport system substrate-binding protein
VSYPARPAKLPLWLAQDSGIFARHGLKVAIKELISSEQLLEAFRGRFPERFCGKTVVW